MKVREIKRFLSQVDNPALLFNKLLILEFIDGFSQNQNLTEKGKDKKGKDKGKDKRDEDVKKIDYINKFKEKVQKPEPPPKVEGYTIEKFRLKTAYRLVIGAGYPSFIENGFLFHHVYGIPYIPGETLKGLAKAVFILSVAEAVKEETKLSNIEKELSEEAEEEVSEEAKGILHQIPDRINIILDNYTIENPVETFRKIFGSKERRGQVIFFDAYPVDFNPSEHFEADIMNSHYGDYYQSGKAPADWLSPTPIHFLALKEGIIFEFSLGLAPLEPMEDNEEKLLLETARKLLEVGLKNFGVGNKKRKGYGWFSDKTVGR
ncbi:MAG: type III-B CRISPR module RAMP protein Cmr6 [Thermocrinis sp.]|jgi:CRISPR-associated protein Cmr6|uniref:type III-B CRISPR module RAMP protein Cmr6 n=1 Tax=Thermocrinis sp. TaxID=2024383 RepID=UPI003C104C8C